ncbi:MAG: hypothetical protein U1F07_02720 [Rubrivivax sp.]
MADERPQDLAARVVAWHNRHPLAERITLQQVHAMGWVALPFRAPGAATEAAATEAGAGETGAVGASPSEAHAVEAGTPKARAAAPRRGWKAAFTEDFVAPLAPARIARFAARHGVEAAPQDGLPVREVQIALPLTRDGVAATLWLETAAIERGSRRVRVLLAPGDAPRAIGPRVWSRPRSSVAAAVSTLALAAAVGLATRSVPAPLHARATVVAQPRSAAPVRPLDPPATVATAATAAAVSASAAAASAVTATAVTAASASRAATGAAGKPQTAIASAALPAHPGSDAVIAAVGTSTPRDTPAAFAAPAPFAARSEVRPAPPPTTLPPPRSTQRRPPDYGVRPRLAPALDEAAKAQARALVAAAREARGARTTTQAAARGAAPAATTPSAPSAWALSTRSLRTRFESEQMLVAMRDVAARDEQAAALRFEVLPVGSDWRAVSWPYAERRDAERMRVALQSRGLRVEVVPF